MLADACHMHNIEDEISQLRTQIEEKNSALKNLTTESHRIVQEKNGMIMHLLAENRRLQDIIKQKDAKLQLLEDEKKKISVQLISDNGAQGTF